MKSLLCVIIVLCATSSSFATGSLYCSADDLNMKFDFEGIVSLSHSDALVESHATLEIKNQTDLPVIKMDKKNVSQYWNHGKEVKLLLYWESTDEEQGDYYSWSSVLIKTKYDKKKSKTVGTYKLKTFVNSPVNGEITKEVNGKITCTNEL